MTEKLTPSQSVKAYCTRCVGLSQFKTAQVRDCQGDQAINGPCPFFPYRLGKRILVRIFRKFCLDCTQGAVDYVTNCPVNNCPCYPYRFGKNPSKRDQGASAEQMKKVRESVKNAKISIFSGQDIENTVSMNKAPDLVNFDWLTGVHH